MDYNIIILLAMQLRKLSTPCAAFWRVHCPLINPRRAWLIRCILEFIPVMILKIHNAFLATLAQCLFSRQPLPNEQSNPHFQKLLKGDDLMRIQNRVESRQWNYSRFQTILYCYLWLSVFMSPTVCCWLSHLHNNIVSAFSRSTLSHKLL